MTRQRHKAETYLRAHDYQAFEKKEENLTVNEESKIKNGKQRMYYPYLKNNAGLNCQGWMCYAKKKLKRKTQTIINLVKKKSKGSNEELPVNELARTNYVGWENMLFVFLTNLLMKLKRILLKLQRKTTLPLTK